MRVTDPAARRSSDAADSPAFPRALTVQEVLTYYARLHCAASSERAPRGLVRSLEIAGLAAAADLRVDALGRADLHRFELRTGCIGVDAACFSSTRRCPDSTPFARRDLRGRIARLARRGRRRAITSRDPAALERLAARVRCCATAHRARRSLATLLGERILEVIWTPHLRTALPDPDHRGGLEAPLTGEPSRQRWRCAGRTACPCGPPVCA